MKKDDWGPMRTQLWEHAMFRRFAQEVIKAEVPTIPTWEPNGNNIEQMKHSSALREGYILCAQKLGVTFDD